jgi:hypothetical protein
MTDALKTTAYREAHDTVDARLADALGLTFALDQMVFQHPELNKADDLTSQAISALLNAIRENLIAAESFHQVEWDVLKGPAEAA